ncbi:hypothetical protein BG261_05395 [Floricoccus tropicus]|uniref:Uncharacterized protein n=1 Tax=Floricoccus tropicus TaxID=1859473 RepID=A0A1E8GKP3_9LACT|nr:hypothetical protein [Floricoccus tropicus]OFI48825.1 hypothetical protein BG261_05395 [Floricoccus tropicus]
MEQLFSCSLCGGLTLLIRKTDKLDKGVWHEYAECQLCKGKVTFFYSDREIRRLLKLQESNPSLHRAKEIQQKMEVLKINIAKH